MYVLVVEDDPRLARVIAKFLKDEGHTVDLALDGDDGLAMAMGASYDVVVLDVMLPGTDGIGVCQSLRNSRVGTPILLLTALDTVDDRVRGLDAGADDYLTKPFAMRELVARIRALGRRHLPPSEPGRIVVGDLVLDLQRRRAMREGQAVELSPKEFALLEVLVRNHGRVVTRGQIVDHVWGYDYEIDPSAIDVYVAYLRRKVDRQFSRKLIKTIRNVGYVLED